MNMTGAYELPLVFALCMISAIISLLIVKRMRFTLVPAILFSAGLITISFWFGSSISANSFQLFDPGAITSDLTYLERFKYIGFGSFALGIFLHTIEKAKHPDREK